MMVAFTKSKKCSSARLTKKTYLALILDQVEKDFEDVELHFFLLRRYPNLAIDHVQES